MQLEGWLLEISLVNLHISESKLFNKNDQKRAGNCQRMDRKIQAIIQNIKRRSCRSIRLAPGCIYLLLFSFQFVLIFFFRGGWARIRMYLVYLKRLVLFPAVLMVTPTHNRVFIMVFINIYICKFKNVLQVQHVFQILWT